MSWNWQLSDWPQFTYDPNRIAQKERQFLLQAGSTGAFFKNLTEEQQSQFIIEILSLEGLESARIEGEVLDRASLQSSIKRNFGLHAEVKQGSKKELGMAKLLCNVYATFDQPLTHEMLWQWHSMLFEGSPEFDSGKYRTHTEPMQIVSNRLSSPRVFFEAPPSSKIPHEMSRFIDWFNSIDFSQPILGRASIAHVYFESIHPFEDGNGRIGRILTEKMLSQGIGKPILVALSKFIEKQKKGYYAELEICNRTLNAASWVEFFSEKILQAQADSMQLLYFLIEKSKIFTALAGRINPRQEKILLRLFEEGPGGFSGGLSAENYIKITKGSRATATRDLADLVEKGALVKTGELRHTRYVLNINPLSML